MITRRTFLKTSATTLAAGLASPSVWSKEWVDMKLSGPNDRIHVGLIGCRNMDWANLTDFFTSSGSRLYSSM
ncbi:MAG: twin-arginine translocation signal domain-containing protein [Tannerellaceae bacterium]|nr:twin-arginine translocation signal domain-containing protein [Tannerellaceae bacterium]